VGTLRLALSALVLGLMVIVATGVFFLVREHLGARLTRWSGIALVGLVGFTYVAQWLHTASHRDEYEITVHVFAYPEKNLPDDVIVGTEVTGEAVRCYGTCTLYVPVSDVPSDHRMLVYAGSASHTLLGVDSVTVAAARDVDCSVILFTHGMLVHGTVVDETYKPVPGASVTLRAHTFGSLGNWVQSPPPSPISVQTTSQGKFLLPVPDKFFHSDLLGRGVVLEAIKEGVGEDYSAMSFPLTDAPVTIVLQKRRVPRGIITAPP